MTIAETVRMIDDVQDELDRAYVKLRTANAIIEILRSERDTWRAVSGR